MHLDYSTYITNTRGIHLPHFSELFALGRMGTRRLTKADNRPMESLGPAIREPNNLGKPPGHVRLFT
jgi:hypothetical protein